MSEDLQRHARSFGGVADAYDRGRPTYPDDAVAWLTSGQPDPEAVRPMTVLELGAGTGKLTAHLLAHGHDVHATEPDEAMLAVLRRNLPGVRTSATTAEQIPLADHTVDVVVAAQCYHWFDPDVALDEINRVLKPGGTFAVVWHERDERIPWVRKLGRIIGTQEQSRDLGDDLALSELFGEADAEVFKHWQTVDRRTIVDLARSRSNLAVMGESERERVLTELLALYDDYGRGMDGMQLPYRTRCFRTKALARPEPVKPEPVKPEPIKPEPVLEPTEPLAFGASIPRQSGVSGQSAGSSPMLDSASTIPRVAIEADDDTGMILIDFR